MWHSFKLLELEDAGGQAAQRRRVHDHWLEFLDEVNSQA
jgi:hypothetical protein